MPVIINSEVKVLLLDTLKSKTRWSDPLKYVSVTFAGYLTVSIFCSFEQTGKDKVRWYSSCHLCFHSHVTYAVCLGFGIKTKWLGLGKDHGLSSNLPTLHMWQKLKTSYKIISRTTTWPKIFLHLLVRTDSSFSPVLMFISWRSIEQTRSF